MSENGLQKDEFILPGNLGHVVIGDQVRDIEKIFKKKDGSVTITIGVSKPQPLTIDGHETGLSFYFPETQIELPPNE